LIVGGGAALDSASASVSEAVYRTNSKIVPD